MVNLKTKSAGDGYPKKAIEKTVLHFLGSRTFSHGLAPNPPLAIPVGSGSIGWIADLHESARHSGSDEFEVADFLAQDGAPQGH